MKKTLTILLVLFLLIPTWSIAEESDLTTIPCTIIKQIYQGDVQQVFDASTADVQAALGSADALTTTFAQVTQVYGAFEEILASTAYQQDGLTVAQITCSHETADVTYVVVVDENALLAQLSILAVEQKVAESTTDPSTYVQEEITLRAGEADETQGMLTLPVGEGPFPVVIMMQGSGPSDMDETAYGIAIFRDIAEGLAQAGVASIRYDKYTYAHADLLQADATIQEEYIIDVQSALALAQEDERLSDIYLLGHSLGAMIIPRVMQTVGADQFVGGVLIAGTPLDLWEIQYNQNLAVIANLDTTNQATAQASLDAEVAKLDTMQTMTDEELQNTTFFGVSAYYQMDLMSVDAAETAIALQKPLFIAQGEKDWQITPEEGIQAWQNALGDQPDVTYQQYSDMTHMLTELEGDATGTTADYQAGSTVSDALLFDIAAWILQ